MEIFAHPVPAAIILLGLLVFVHEAGHFLAGRLCGIGVEVFSIGFGPPIFRYNHKGTDYRLSWIPLGGYVKFYGMSPAEDVPDEFSGKEFYKAPLKARALTMAAGPGANFLLAIVTYAILGYSGIPHAQPMIGEIQQGSPAVAAGLQYEDRVLEIDGEKIQTWQEMRDLISASPGKALNLKVEREGKQLLVRLTPESVNASNFVGKEVPIGRAGVARGSLTSIVSVNGPETLAAKAGILSGDKIIGVKVQDQWKEVTYWRGFLRELSAQVAEKNKSITIKVQAVTPDGELDKQAEVREVNLSLKGVTAVDSNEAELTYAQKLGLSDAQLVIGKMDGELAGPLKKGDILLRWNGEEVRDIYQLSEMQMKNKLSRARLDLSRNFKPIEVNLTLTPLEVQKPSGKDTIHTLPMVFLGQIVEPAPWIEKHSEIHSALLYGMKETGAQTVMLVATLGKLITGDFPLKALGGPMMIAKVAGDSAKAGWKTFIGTMSLISVNLAVINLFPIPVLDGGQLVICAVEGIRRRRLSEMAIENFQKVGFVMILALVVLATYNDLSRFWTSMLESVTGMFQ